MRAGIYISNLTTHWESILELLRQHGKVESKVINLQQMDLLFPAQEYYNIL